MNKKFVIHKKVSTGLILALFLQGSLVAPAEPRFTPSVNNTLSALSRFNTGNFNVSCKEPSEFAALAEEGIEVSLQTQFEIRVGIELLLEGKTPASVNGFLIEKHGEGIKGGVSSIEFLPDADITHDGDSLRARFLVKDRKDIVFEVEYTREGGIRVKKVTGEGIYEERDIVRYASFPATIGPAEEKTITAILESTIDFNAIEKHLFPYEYLDDHEKMRADQIWSGGSMDAVASIELCMVQDQRKYAYAFETYEQQYRSSKKDFLETLGKYKIITEGKGDADTELGKDLIRKRDVLRKIIAKIKMFNYNYYGRDRYFYINNGSGKEMIQDDESRRYSLAPGVIFRLMEDSEIEDEDVVVDPFAGPGNLLTMLAVEGASSRIIGCDLCYGEPSEGERRYAIRRNLDEVQRILDVSVPEILRLKLGTVDIIRHDATKLPMSDASVDKIFTDPPYGREGHGLTEAEAFVIFMRAMRESVRVLKDGGTARFVSPGEWGEYLKELGANEVLRKDPERMFNRFCDLVKVSEFYDKRFYSKGLGFPEQEYREEEWIEVGQIFEVLFQDNGRCVLEIVDIKPSFFFPLNIIKVSKNAENIMTVQDINSGIRDEYEMHGNFVLPEGPDIRSRRLFELRDGKWILKKGDGVVLGLGAPFPESMIKNVREIMEALRGLEPDPAKLLLTNEEDLHVTVETLITNTEKISDDEVVKACRETTIREAQKIAARHAEAEIRFSYDGVSMDEGGNIAVFGYMANMALYDLRNDIRRNGLSAKPTNIVHMTFGRIFDKELTQEKFDEYKALLERFRARKDPDGKPAVLAEITADNVKILDQAVAEGSRYGNEHNAVLLGKPVNVYIDVGVIPDRKDQLEENLETIAWMIAYNRVHGLSIRYAFLNDKDGSARKVLERKLRLMGNVPGMDTADLMACLGPLHSGENVIDIRLENKDTITMDRRLDEREYVVALKNDDGRPGLPVPNYPEALEIGISLANLRIAEDERGVSAEKNRRYETLFRRTLERFREVYEKHGIRYGNCRLSEDELELMVLGCSAARLYYTVLYALPPAEKAVEGIHEYHEMVRYSIMVAA